MKIVAVNVRYSPNLGDGVIADCLQASLKRRLPNAAFIDCDLAGRIAYSEKAGRLRAAALSVSQFLPEKLVHHAFAAAFETLVRRRLLPFYREAMLGADAVLIGGGQLLADDKLNFPMKLAGAIAAAKDASLPIAVHGVGVGRFWSDTGARLFRESFDAADLFWATVRDNLSAKRWRRHFETSQVPAVRLAFDVGLLASRIYDDPPRQRGARPRAGLCVTRPETLKAHFDGDDWPEDQVGAAFYKALARALIARGMDVYAFTNGAPDDDAFLRRCFGKPGKRSAKKGEMEIAPRFATPRALASAISGCDVVVGHRLHAHVLAYSYRKAHVGLSLNRKLDEFFALTGRANYLIRPEAINPEFVADKMQAALADPVSETAHAGILKQVEDEMDALAEAIERAARAEVFPAPPVHPPALEVVRNA